MRVLRHRNIAGELGFAAAVYNRHLGIADGLEVASFYRCSNAFHVEHNHPVAVVTHGACKVYCTL